jgi:hypothetical protein
MGSGGSNARGRRAVTMSWRARTVSGSELILAIGEQIDRLLAFPLSWAVNKPTKAGFPGGFPLCVAYFKTEIRGVSSPTPRAWTWKSPLRRRQQ